MCTCRYEQIEENVQVLIEECSECRAAREAQALRNAKQNEIQENKIFLQSTDYKVLRHKEQLDSGIATTLSSVEYTALLAARQDARARINELEATL